MPHFLYQGNPWTAPLLGIGFLWLLVVFLVCWPVLAFRVLPEVLRIPREITRP